MAATTTSPAELVVVAFDSSGVSRRWWPFRAISSTLFGVPRFQQNRALERAFSSTRGISGVAWRVVAAMVFAMVDGGLRGLKMD
nr:hypothetical protein Itr_chr04CG19790 [Ipomoea trifida]